MYTCVYLHVIHVFVADTHTQCRPTQRELLSLGKRIIVFSARAQNDFIFPDFTLPGWDKDTVKYFTPYPACGGYAADQWYLVGGESQVVGPLCEWRGQ